MGKSAPAAPAAPDPLATAAAQSTMNKETAQAQSYLNQVNEYTPYGSSVFSPTGQTQDGIQQMQRTTTLSPDQQAMLDQQTGIQRQLGGLASGQISRVGEAVAQPFSYEGMAAAPTADAAARQQTIDALYGQSTSRLDPRFATEQTALETQLANQGIMVGSDAYSKAMESQGRSKSDAYQTALNAAIGGGGAEQSRLFGLQGNERERAIQEASYLRNMPLNEVSALMGTGGGIQNPQFSPTPQTGIAGTDYSGLVNQQYKGQQNQYNQQVGQQNANMQGLYGLGAAALPLMFSDKRVKKDIKKVGTLDNGLPVYSFKYIWGGPQQIGLMAQDVEKVTPEAVIEFGGVKMVDYEMAVA